MNELQKFISGLQLRMGFIDREDSLDELIRLDRLFPVLVRCGCCRFTCAAQDVRHLKKCIEAAGDYVRDVSIPAGMEQRAASWVPESPVTPLSMFPRAFTQVPERKGRPEGPVFDERDCGGVYDGFGVVSDADPGL